MWRATKHSRRALWLRARVLSALRTNTRENLNTHGFLDEFFGCLTSVYERRGGETLVDSARGLLKFAPKAPAVSYSTPRSSRDALRTR